MLVYDMTNDAFYADLLVSILKYTYMNMDLNQGNGRPAHLTFKEQKLLK